MRYLRWAPCSAGITQADSISQVRNDLLLRNYVLVALDEDIPDMVGYFPLSVLGNAITVQKKMLTIPNIMRGDDLKLLLDVWVEETVEVKPIWTFLPAR